MKNRIILCCLLMVLSSTVRGQLKVSSLRVEHCVNPSVVDVQRPRLSWVNEPKNERVKGQRQTAYRIVVASSEERLRRGDYDLWDSGRVPSDVSVLVPYGGKELTSRQDCYWKVQTWDVKGRRSKWSPVSHWTMGLLKPSDWKATWITARQPEGAPMFRKTFNLNRKVTRAKAFVTAGGYFELYVNGKKAQGEDLLVPNFTNYTTREGLDKGGIALENSFTAYRVLYLSYDVTALLQQGRNAMGAMLGDGFYRSTSYHVGSFGEPCFLCQLDVTYDDGTTESICTDETWLTHPSSITLTGVYDGEVYDARLEVPRWAEADADESSWKPVEKAIAPVGRLTAHTSPTDRITEVLQPVSFERQDSIYVITFEKEIAGWIRLKDIKGEKGQKVEVEYVCESPLGKEAYICKGSQAGETYAPRFTWYVFSQVKVRGLGNLTAGQVQAEAVNTDVPLASEFRCSHPLLNRINAIWQRSQLDNMHGCIASDCPHRERLPYTGDGQIASAMVMLSFDAAAFYQKWLRDMRDAQNPTSGYVPNGAPWQPTCGGGVAWGAAMNVIPWEYYLQYGDLEQLRLCYQPMRDQLRHMLTWLTPDGTMFQQKRNQETGEVCYWLNLGDWVPPYANPSDEIVHTFYLWLCATNTAKAAKVLGDEAGRQESEAVAQRTWEAFHKKFYDKQNATYGDFGPNILALYMGVPEEWKDAVVETLRKEIMDVHGGHINTGFVTTKFFFETLTDYGLHDVATSAILKTDYPSYGHWIEQGATVTWEQWDGQNSHNHPMFGGGLTWLPRRLAGVNVTPEGAGYKHFVVKPVPAVGVDTVYYSLQTPQGMLSSHVISHEGKLRSLEVRVPVGSTATICLPSQTIEVEQGKHQFFEDSLADSE
ncbi:MAG: family 78 glycoside hydrolase catalytic domain [Bacteroidaceae bacterium]|nr:family 78 glycoside hydrolase catalytic domain [Bacteroidaceae bacterium]